MGKPPTLCPGILLSTAFSGIRVGFEGSLRNVCQLFTPLFDEFPTPSRASRSAGTKSEQKVPTHPQKRDLEGPELPRVVGDVLPLRLQVMLKLHRARRDEVDDLAVALSIERMRKL